MLSGISTLARGRLPTNTISSNLRIIRTSHRFFHRRQNHLRKPYPANVSLRSARSILWSYASAPTNLLFVGTNILGLTVFGAWRLLHTTATMNRNNNNNIHEDTKSGDMKREPVFDGFLKNQGMGDLIQDVSSTTSVTPMYVNDDGDEVYSVVGLPLTESDLEELGPSQTLSIHDDHSNQTMIKHLLTLYHIHNSMGLIINEEGVNLEALTAMPDSVKKSFAFSMVNLVPEDKQHELRSISDVISHVDVTQLMKTMRKQSLQNDYELYKSIHDTLSLERIETTPLSKPKDAQTIREVLKKYKDQDELNTTFLLDAATSFMKRSVNDIGFIGAYELINKHPNNENLQILGNLLSIHLLKHTHLICSEKLFHLMVKNTITTSNEKIFHKLLAYLNITPELLQRNKSKKAQYLVRKITHGSSLKNYTYDLSTYLTAIKGMHVLQYQDSDVRNTIKKLFKGLTVNGRVLYFNDFNDINSFDVNLDGINIDGEIDNTLKKLITKLRSEL
ncbi:hypothetical protein WICPIJ_008357 [Wickerhamomyces pijperi]|uniref:Uncharacterized protein n=1 Tax=Wickerhamomyces pijperi TaxID=599730 RepID=A0A9P8TIL3_WICPI|nr:hypothetical protein WICPIJ_008357 [Wickerhamomyces pijperi]